MAVFWKQGGGELSYLDRKLLCCLQANSTQPVDRLGSLVNRQGSIQTRLGQGLSHEKNQQKTQQSG